jgi:hypothetical protein
VPLSALRRGAALHGRLDGASELPGLRARFIGAGCGRRPGGVRHPLSRTDRRLAAIVEIKFAPPVWLHLLLWTPLILVGAILMLRPLKAALIALQFKHNLLHHDPPSA